MLLKLYDSVLFSGGVQSSKAGQKVQKGSAVTQSWGYPGNFAEEGARITRVSPV